MSSYEKNGCLMRTRLLIQVLIGWVLSSQAYGQVVHTYVLATRDSANLSINDGSSQNLSFYQLTPPPDVPVRGLLVLLPGFDGPAQDVFRETKLPQEAARIGLITIVPTLNNRLYLDQAGKQLIDAAIRQVLTGNAAAGRRLVMGGFSAGGHLALSYAETLLANDAQERVVLTAAFGVDPPLDMREFWHLGQRRIEQNCSKLLRREGQRIVASLTNAFGGPPDRFPVQYLNGSAFAGIDSLGGNARWLTSTPVRIYAEPDLAYWREQYCPAFTADDLTAKTAEQMIERLRKLGNAQAQYIATNGRGFLGNRRFPHAWSILDANECVAWLQTLL